MHRLPPVLAGSQVDLATTIMPLDFDAAQYEAFCLGQSPPMGDAAYSRGSPFPNALVPEQGDELVIRLTAFAGIKVVVVEIPILNWGIDVDSDFSEMCSLALAWLNVEDVAQELPGQGFDLGKAITAAGYNCGTYTTPFGKDEDGEPRGFPFMGFFDQMIRADCAEAFARGETIVVGGEAVPLCTGLILGIPGARGSAWVLLGGRNLGSVEDAFDNFSLALSNQIQLTGPFEFEIDPDNDGDTLADEDDFGPDGQPREVRDEDGDGVADEDPPDDWRAQPADLGAQAILGVAPYRTAEDRLTLRVSPFAHPSTKPGRYPFQVKGDSRGARLLGMAEVDASGHPRLGATDVGFIEVVAFRDVRLAVTPPEATLKPGLTRAYAIEGSNMGNETDSMTLALQFRDSNQAGCGLASLGSQPGCPERAFPTRIEPGAWTTAGALPAQFGPLEPLGIGAAGFAVTVPREWEGMRDTTY